MKIWRTIRWAGSGALIMTALLAGCGSDDVATGPLATATPSTSDPSATVLPPTTSPSSSATTRRPSESSTRSPATGPSVSGSGAEPSPFQRRQTPPGGVAEQFRIGSLGATGCSLDVTVGQQNESTFEVGDEESICVYGFSVPGTVTLEVTKPDGSVDHLQLDSDGGVDYRIALGDVLGTYKVVARQGTTEATASFQVLSPRRPRAFTLPPYQGPPGTTFSVGLAGFPAQQQFQLDLYRFLRREGSSSVWEYQAPLTVVRMNGRGEALFGLSTRPDDPVGSYCVVPRIEWSGLQSPSCGGGGFRGGWFELRTA